MNRFFVRAAITAAVFTLPAPIASADIYYYAVSRSVTYTQTSNAQPSIPEFWSLTAVLFPTVPGEVLSGTLAYNVPPPVSYPLVIADHISQYSSAFYTDQAQFLLDFPATTYTLAVDRGSGIESGDVFVPEDLFCPEIPYLTGDTFDRLQNYNSSLAFDGGINGFTLAAGTDVGSNSVTVVEQGVPNTAWQAVLQPGDTAFQIPAGVLLPSTNYSISVVYNNGVQVANGGFGAATSEAQFQRGTSALFTTLSDAVPCPGDVNGDGVVDLTDLAILLSHFGTSSGASLENGDLNGDEVVDLTDLAILLSQFGTVCS